MVEGVVATMGVAHQLLEDAATTARDHNEKMGWATFDPERFRDVLASLATIAPAQVGDLRLVELLAAYPPLLRDAGNIAAASTRRGIGAREIGSGVWTVLHDAEQKSIGLYAEAGRILTLAQARRRRWMLW